MKNARIIAIALIGLGLAMASSCTKEHRTDGNAPVFKAGVERSAKTSYSEATNLIWTEGDQVAIFGATATAVTYHPENINGDKCDLVASEGNPGDGPYTAIYPVTIATGSNTVTLPRVQASTSGELTGYPMYAESNSTVLSFKNLCSILKITMQKEGTSITKIQLITDQFMNGDFTIDYNGGEPTLEPNASTTNNTKVATLELASAVDISSSHDFYIYLPAGTYNYFQIKVYDNTGCICTRTTTSGLTFNRSEYNYLTIPESAINFVPGDLTGKFSISATQKVTFSKGNLLQNGSNYYFADNQYDYSKNGYTNTFNWASSTSATNYIERGNNPIVNGGNTANMWRTLTFQEWAYLLSTRTTLETYNGTNYRWALAQVTKANGSTTVGGIIVFPDDFHWPLEDSRRPGTVNRAMTGQNLPNWNGITYTYDEWLILEQAGCVFLPASNNQNNATNFYWTASEWHTNSDNSSNDGAVIWLRPTGSSFNQNLGSAQHRIKTSLSMIRLAKNI